MDQLHVFATIHPHAAYRDEVLSILAAILAVTRCEAGCKRFELNVGLKDDPNLYLVETWDTEADLAAHHRMPYTREAAARLDGKLAEETQVIVMTTAEDR